MTWKFTNNAQSTVATSINATATTLLLAAGGGALFPTITAAGQAFKLTHINATGHPDEIVNVTARTSDTLTLQRGQEGTTAVPWAAGDIVGSLVTAEEMINFVQKANGTHGCIRFTANGSWTVPLDWIPGDVIQISACGGGGAGGAMTSVQGVNAFAGAGGGGAGQALVFASSAKNPGDVMTFVVGAGGVFNVSQGGSTTTSTNGVLGISLAGGQNGTAGGACAPATGNSAINGFAGTGYPDGSDGSDLLYNTYGTGDGGAGASGPFGGGGGAKSSTLTTLINGSAAYGFGSGGGGGPGKIAGDSLSAVQTSQPGMPGIIIISW